MRQTPVTFNIGGRMSRPNEVHKHFLSQTEACEKLGSPFTAELCRVLAAGLDSCTRTGARILGWPGPLRADAVALRLCGGLHQLVLSQDDAALQTVYPPNSPNTVLLASAVMDAIGRHDDFLYRTLDSAPQTNEVARSAILLPGFETIRRHCGLPLELNEIGSSAGLNLLPDLYHYRFGPHEWGNEDFAVTFAPDVTGTPPLPPDDLPVAGRHGCDLYPIDINQSDDLTRLKSYVWPDQKQRMTRMEAALAVARTVEFKVQRIDAETFVSERLLDRREGCAFVLFHSILWQYLPERIQQTIKSLIGTAGEAVTSANPIYWLRMENALQGPGAELRLTSWPGDGEHLLARCDFHGRWIEWIGG